MRSRSLAALALTALVLPLPALPAQTIPASRANYELASRWTSQKVGRLVFDTSVTPHWLDAGDKFWYTYATAKGRQYWLVDCREKTKKPLFDNARMAAMLTRITLTPYESQHLALRNIKFVKNDTAFQFEIEMRKDASILVGDQVKTVQDAIGDEATKSDDMQDKTKGTQSDKQLDKDLEKQKQVEKQKDDVKDQQKQQELKQQETQKQKEQVKTDTKTDTQTDKKQTEQKGTTQAKPTAEPASPTKTLFFEYDLKTEKVTLLPTFKGEPKKLLWASVSPDEKTVIFARGHNLFMMDAASYAILQKKADNPKTDDKAVKEVQLTNDGEENYSYARTLKEDNKKIFQRQDKDRKDFRVPPIGIVWSKDSSKVAFVRDDSRKVAPLWVINSLSLPRPTLETYTYEMPGEENQPQYEMVVFDLATRTPTKIKADKFKDQTLDIQEDRVLSREREKDKVVSKWLSDSPDKLYFNRLSRDLHRVDVCVADTKSGEVKVLVEERLNTYIETKPLRLINGGKEMLFWSERDGWGHIYRYTTDGKLIGQVTSGEFNCQGIVGVDEKTQMLYVSVCGKEADEDPYFTHVYSVPLTGGKDGTPGKMTLVNPGNFNHASAMDDDARFCVDNSSRVNTAPHSELRDAKGNLLLNLEDTDLTALLESGYKYPEPFKIKADDGVTDLYGVLYKPFDFDPRRSYPIIEYVYPGPQTEAVSKSFSPRSANMALAQFGFIVIEVGNRGGSPQRSKWYHNFGYGNLRDYGLADKKRAVEQLALKYSWIDTDRVGIYGHSGGGFMSAAAMLVYPDFYKVAFSESGNHENNIYNRWWSETHNGVKEVDKDGKISFQYDIDKNTDIAKNLKGHLMLVTGDIDDNVHPANTIRLANALIKANKRFDYFQFPGQRHSFGDMSDYCFWLRADYFCKNLLGDSQTTVDLMPLDREQAQTGSGQVSRAGGATGAEGPESGENGEGYDENGYLPE